MAMQGNLNRTSSFSDDILGHILTFLPMRDAVRTSILSTRWRYIFASMSTLDFDQSSVVTRRNVTSFKRFVDRLLYFPNQVSLECFRLTCLRVTYNDYLPGWICAALCRGVKEIDVHFFPLGDVLPTLLFTSHSLMTLKLDVEGSVIKVPSTVCLPNLKTLHFRKLVLTDGYSIPGLISSCLVLEDLVLAIFECDFDNISELNIHNLSLKRFVLDFEEIAGIDFDNVMVINAPSLLYFQYIGIVAEDYTFSNMTSLGKADIRISSFDNMDREQSATRLLQGICNVQSLYLTIDDDEGTCLHYYNLVELEFHNRRDDWRGTWLVEFLHCVPNLKTIILNLAVATRNFRSLPKDVPSCLSFHLEEMKISNFQGDTHMFEMISYFLDNAVVLEKLKIGMESLCERERSSIFKKLSSLPMNSKKCHVMTF